MLALPVERLLGMYKVHLSKQPRATVFKVVEEELHKMIRDIVCLIHNVEWFVGVAKKTILL